VISSGSGFDRTCGGFARQVLELGENLPDQIQLRRVFGQGEEPGVSDANQLRTALAL